VSNRKVRAHATIVAVRPSASGSPREWRCELAVEDQEAEDHAAGGRFFVYGRRMTGRLSAQIAESAWLPEVGRSVFVLVEPTPSDEPGVIIYIEKREAPRGRRVG
jgi:hypothetical protein